MKDLYKNSDVSLLISWKGGEDILIPAGMELNDKSRIYYPLSYLAQMYRNIEIIEAGKKKKSY